MLVPGCDPVGNAKLPICEPIDGDETSCDGDDVCSSGSDGNNPRCESDGCEVVPEPPVRV